MVFEVSIAKRQILRELTLHDQTPTGLAEILSKSPNTVYNHLNQLHEQGDRTDVAPLERRSDSQYVDIRAGEINIPRRQFGSEDADQILQDAEALIHQVDNIVDS